MGDVQFSCETRGMACLRDRQCRERVNRLVSLLGIPGRFIKRNSSIWWATLTRVFSADVAEHHCRP